MKQSDVKAMPSCPRIFGADFDFSNWFIGKLQAWRDRAAGSERERRQAIIFAWVYGKFSRIPSYQAAAKQYEGITGEVLP